MAISNYTRQFQVKYDKRIFRGKKETGFFILCLQMPLNTTNFKISFFSSRRYYMVYNSTS